jgi:delta 1-pyrroline-5-carboxylate dehydrogenase
MEISVDKAQSIREELGATHLVMFTMDSEGGQNVATHGETALQSLEAAEAGNKLKRLLGWPEEFCNTKPKPKSLDTKVIAKAAQAHAKDQLGDEQFKANKDARRAVAEDFRAGVDWTIRQVGRNIVLRLHSDKTEPESPHLSEFLMREAGQAKWDAENSQWEIQLHSALDIFWLGANWQLFKSQGYSFVKAVSASEGGEAK